MIRLISAAVAGVVDGEPAGVPEDLGLAPQDAHARGVERRDPHPLGALRADERADALPHLARRLVREGDREDLARPRLPRLEQARDAVREHTGLARAGSRDDEQGAAAVEHGLPLLRVQPVEQRGGLFDHLRHGDRC